MPHLSPRAVWLGLSILLPCVASAQIDATKLVVSNYQIVTQQQLTRSIWQYTYRADLVNKGPSLPALTGTATSLVSSIVVIPGGTNLHFPPVPSNGTVTSLNTFTVTVDRSQNNTSFSNLQWSFNSPVANAGANQTVGEKSTVTVDASKSTNPSGVGSLSYSWAFSSRPPGTLAVLQFGTTVMPTFVADVAGTFVLTLTVTNGAGSDSSTVTITSQNTPPVASAGPNQTVKLGASVTLDGSGSHDVNGDALTYAWTLSTTPAGSSAILTGPTTVSPTFVADKAGTYVATLTVNDGQVNSAASIVTITTGHTPPVANAGPNQVVTSGTMVTLDGSQSTDPDGNPITYSWVLNSRPAGSTAILANPSSVNPTFMADVAGQFVAQLTVSDNFGSSNSSTVTITSNAQIQKPTANAGPNQSLGHGSVVTLSGTGTDPQSLPLTYLWSLIAKPNGSTAVLSSTTIQGPMFTADKPGSYVAQLIVNNGTRNSDPSTVTISSTNVAPVANAGSNQNVAAGSTVTLDGSGSSDAEHDPLTYSWVLLNVPGGSSATLNFPASVNPTFVADVGGQYVAQLTVSDPYASSAPVTVTITATSSGISLTPNPLNLATVAGTMTASIGSPAGATGQVITLTSFDQTVVTVPPTALIGQGNTSVTFTVTPVGVGNTTVFASGSGLQPGSATVNVVIPTISVTLSSGTVGISKSVTGTVTLSVPAPPTGTTVNLGSSPTGIVTIPSSITISSGNSTGTFTVTGVSSGTANIAASSPGYVSGSTSVTASPLGVITVPPNVTVGQGQSVPLGISLISPAPSGGVTITLVSSDTAKLTVSPSVFIAEGTTTPATPAQITGVALGSATITASAPGFTGDSKLVQVAVTLSFTPPALTVGIGAAQNLVLTLSGVAPSGGLLVNLISDNTGVATVAPTVTIPQGTSTVNVPVNGVSAGAANVTASSTVAGVTSGSAAVTVVTALSLSTASVTSGTVGSAYTASISATGGTGPYTFSATGLPAGLSINAAGQITGTPTTPGSASATFTVTDSSSPTKLTASSVVAMTINGPLAITTTSPLPGGALTFAYNATITAGGGLAPYTFSSTALPAGLSLSSSGLITGTPTATGTTPVTFTVTDSTSPAKVTATATLSITINAALTITNGPLPNGAVGTAYNVTMTATGGQGPYTFTSTALPAGLSLSTGGQITGTPTTANTTPVTFTVTDSTSPTKLTATASLSITVNAALSITTTTLVNGVVGAGYTASVGATGGTGPYTFTSSAMPAGLSLSSTGQITGTPTATGTTSVTFTVTDSTSPKLTATTNLSITINQGLSITNSQLPNGAVSLAYNGTLTAGGGTSPYTYTSTALPAGLSLSSSGQITGTPTAPGTTSVTFTVTDSTSPTKLTATAIIPITINAALAITTSTLPGGVVGAGYSAQLAASGGTSPYTFASTALPAGLSLSSTGQISGTPTVVGPVSVTFTATDTSSPNKLTATATMTIAIGPGLTISTSTLPGGFVGAGYSASVAASGGTSPYTFTSTALPAGLSLSSTGQITGTPTAAGPTSVTFTATDSTVPTKLTTTATLTITISAGVSITTPSLPGGIVGEVYSSSVAASGGSSPYTFTSTALPAGLSLSSAGQITGTPTAAGPTSVTFTATDSTSPTKLTGTATLTITIVAGPSITNSSLPTGTVSAPYSGGTLASTGGTSPYTYTSTALPAGLSLSSGGAITGTPTTSGTTSVTFTVTDSSSPTKLTNTATISIKINPPVAFTTTSLTGGSVGSAYTASLTASGGTAPYTFSGTGLPAGLSVNAAGAITGTPTASGTVTAMFTVTDSSLPTHLTANVSISITITPVLSIVTNSLQAGSIGSFYQQMLTATGGIMPYSWSILSGSLPSGLNFDSSSGTISGIPIAAANMTPITFKVIDSSTPFQSATVGLTLTVVDPNSSALSLSGPTAIGKGLQALVTVTLSRASASPISVTVSSSNAGSLVLAARSGDVGTVSQTINVTAGTTSFSIYAQGLATSGSVNVTASASGYLGASLPVQLAQSGFVLSGPNGIGGSFNVNQLTTTTLNVSAAQLDSTGAFVQTQSLAGGTNVAVSFGNSNGGVGSLSAPSVSFSGGGPDTTQVTFTASSTFGTTILSATPPLGFNTPSQSANQLVVTVLVQKVLPDSVTVGKGLETNAHVALQGAPSSDITVTLTSKDPTKVLLSTDGISAGTPSINVIIKAGRSFTPDFYVYGLASSGTVNYTADVPTFGSADGTVTLGAAGFVIAGPFGLGSNFFTTVASPASDFTVTAVLLDSTGNFVDQQAVAGGSTVNVNVTSSNTSTGTITVSPVVLTGGMSQGTTQFQPVAHGSSTITAAAPGFTVPAQFGSVGVSVTVPNILVDGSDTVGYNLEQQGFILLNAPAPAGGLPVTFTVTSGSGLIAFSATATGAGSSALTVTIPAGETSGTYFIYGLNNLGTATYSASGPGFNSGNGTVTLAPSGLIIANPFGVGFPINASIAAGKTPVSVSTAVLDPNTFGFVNTQPLAGGITVSGTLTVNDTSIGTVPSPVTITGGNDTATAQFTPLQVGQTFIKVSKPQGYSPPSDNSQVTVNVSN